MGFAREQRRAKWPEIACGDPGHQFLVPDARGRCIGLKVAAISAPRRAEGRQRSRSHAQRKGKKPV
jgi:hypothetical protein